MRCGSGLPVSRMNATPRRSHPATCSNIQGWVSASVSTSACTTELRWDGPSVHCTSTRRAPATYACSTTARTISAWARSALTTTS